MNKILLDTIYNQINKAHKAVNSPIKPLKIHHVFFRHNKCPIIEPKVNQIKPAIILTIKITSEINKLEER